MHFSPVTLPHRLTVALGSNMFAIKLVFLDYKDLKVVLSKLSLMTLSARLLQQLNFHQAPNLAVTAVGQRHCSGPQKIQRCFLQKYVLFQSYFVSRSQFYSFKIMTNFNLSQFVCFA